MASSRRRGRRAFEQKFLPPDPEAGLKKVYLKIHHPKKPSGKNPHTILFVPGFGVSYNHNLITDTCVSLQNNGFKVIRMSYPQTTLKKKSRILKGKDELESILRSVKFAAENSAKKKIVLIAHSMGAALTLSLIPDIKKYVSVLILVSPNTTLGTAGRIPTRKSGKVYTGYGFKSGNTAGVKIKTGHRIGKNYWNEKTKLGPEIENRVHGGPHIPTHVIFDPTDRLLDIPNIKALGAKSLSLVEFPKAGHNLGKARKEFLNSLLKLLKEEELLFPK